MRGEERRGEERTGEDRRAKEGAKHATRFTHDSVPHTPNRKAV